MNDDWKENRLYIIECLKKLNTDVETNTKQIADKELTNVVNYYKLKEEVNILISDLSKTVLKIQIRMSLITTGIMLLITIISNILFKHYIK